MRKQFSSFVLAALVASLSLLSGCDSSSNKGDSSSSSTSSSSSSSGTASSSSGEVILGNVQVHYPPRFSQTQASSIHVRGVVVDPSLVQDVTVNGVSALTDDNWSTWSVEVALEPGENALLIEEVDQEGNSAEVDQITVHNQPAITSPTKLVLDEANNRLYVLDRLFNNVIAIDRETGARSQLSPVSGTDNLLNQPTGIVLDSARNRLIVYHNQKPTEKEDDPQNPEFVAIDLTTGEQSSIIALPIETIALFNAPMAMTVVGDEAYLSDRGYFFYDEKGDRISVEQANANPSTSRYATCTLIYKLHLVTLTRTEISSCEIGAGVNYREVSIPALSYDAGNKQLWAFVGSGSSTRIYAVKVETGNRTAFSVNNTKENPFTYSNPLSLSFDEANNRLLLLNNSELVTIDVDTKNASTISSNSIPENGDYALTVLTDFIIDSANNRFYVADDKQDAIFLIDGETGERSVVASAGVVDTKGYLTNVSTSDIIFGKNHNIYLLDEQQRAIYGYNLHWGHKYIVHHFLAQNLKEAEDVIKKPLSASWDSNGETLWLLNTSSLLSKINMTTLEKTAVAAITTINPPRQIITVPESDDAYIITAAEMVKFTLGDQLSSQVLSNSYGTPDRRNQFQNIQASTLDLDNNRLLSADSALNAILATDLTSGERTLLSKPSTTPEATDALMVPRVIQLDAANERALVLDTSRKAIVSVSLIDGTRSDVYRYADESPRRIFQPTKMAIHPTYGYILLSDSTTNSIIALDLQAPTPQVVNITR